MKRNSLAAPFALAVALMVPQGALAAGGPVPPVQNSYIGVAGSPYRYAALDARDSTVVTEREAGAGQAVPGLRVSGHYGIPGVDYSGSLTGLSADGRTLVLAQIPGNTPPRTTRLLVLDAAPLSVRARLTLNGWSNVDAISPDGRWLYLIHYPSADVSRYEVLAYDLPAHRLLPQPVVDPSERDEAMTGFPVSRVMSPGGRWAYTLYFRPSGVPFIHALDTTRHEAMCIDLPSLGNVDVTSAHLGLAPGGGALQISATGMTWASINTRTFKVTAGGGQSAPASTRPRPAPRGHQATRGQGGVPWALVVLAIAALGMLAAGVAAARSRRHPTYDRTPDGAIVIHVDARHADGALDEEGLPVA